MTNNNEKLKVFVRREKARLLELMKEFNEGIYHHLIELDAELIRMEKESIAEPIKLKEMTTLKEVYNGLIGSVNKGIPERE